MGEAFIGIAAPNAILQAAEEKVVRRRGTDIVAPRFRQSIVA